MYPNSFLQVLFFICRIKIYRLFLLTTKADKLSSQLNLMSISDMVYKMIKSWRFYLIICLVFNSGLALAGDQSTYAIDSVVVNASGKSPSQARINAVASGQRNAFITLLGRLGMDENSANTLTDETIADMVSSQQIIDEKIAGNNYSATLNLTFSESFVKHYLGNKTNNAKEVPKTDTYLLIPIKAGKAQSLIWEQNNDWKLAWENIIKNNKVATIKLPSGDIDDISNFNVANINDGNFSGFESAINKYKADAVMLAYFEFDSIENKVDIILKTVRKFHSSQVKLDFVNVNQLSPEDLVGKVTTKTFEYIAGTSKVSSETNAANNPPVLVSINIDVLVSDLGDWLTVKNKLENSNIVSQLKINSISKDLVKINISYNKVNGDIINFFAKYNLFLEKKSEGKYTLSLAKKQPKL